MTTPQTLKKTWLKLRIIVKLLQFCCFILSWYKIYYIFISRRQTELLLLHVRYMITVINWNDFFSRVVNIILVLKFSASSWNKHCTLVKQHSTATTCFIKWRKNRRKCFKCGRLALGMTTWMLSYFDFLNLD